jgi:hypothetical protein
MHDDDALATSRNNTLQNLEDKVSSHLLRVLISLEDPLDRLLMFVKIS